jgi:hypothetical protein
MESRALRRRSGGGTGAGGTGERSSPFPAQESVSAVPRPGRLELTAPVAETPLFTTFGITAAEAPHDSHSTGYVCRLSPRAPPACLAHAALSPSGPPFSVCDSPRAWPGSSSAVLSQAAQRRRPGRHSDERRGYAAGSGKVAPPQEGSNVGAVVGRATARAGTTPGNDVQRPPSR